ncbi:helix-turn-helix domain-containing protein [Actinoalloteichus hymeniacidonis]|uniref:Transcriptional regulator n=1 Tax=Actinoalloteichus hymeniacidonis TaxID=340345 RepID=A0AAC9HNR9_9PSEU|nr:helix-turn-helix transcriptional regulator [Actinoalloteichus hymeniacidonis]AOS62692.1 putative transcriptional regulator [Actinoalloteichus hymeniacidonis]MBB5909277.1 transcriptional regulator with XRE-family HTH domain [Actinoalloteichus hymeniacidonis]
MAVLLREAIGERLRHERTAQRRTLREVSRIARVSLGYLSEVERGRKEASSELLAAICHALELELARLLDDVATDIRGELDSETVPVQAAATSVERAPGHGTGDIEGGRLVPSVIGADMRVQSDMRVQPVRGRARLGSTMQITNKVVVAA